MLNKLQIGAELFKTHQVQIATSSTAHHRSCYEFMLGRYNGQLYVSVHTMPRYRIRPKKTTNANVTNQLQDQHYGLWTREMGEVLQAL